MVDYEILDIGILVNIGSIFEDKEFRGIFLDEKVKTRNVLP
jgi:hypothetical protein